MQKIKGEKGITLVVLVLTIMVLSIISIPTTLKISEILSLNKLAKFKDDFTILNETVSQVYPQGMSLSGIGALYNENTNQLNKNPNDNSTYYVIDMNKLSNDLYHKVGVTVEVLNYGKSNYTRDNLTTDVYIINEQSRTIYYVEGFKDASGHRVYRYPGSYTEIEIEDFDTY